MQLLQDLKKFVKILFLDLFTELKFKIAYVYKK